MNLIQWFIDLLTGLWERLTGRRKKRHDNPKPVSQVSWSINMARATLSWTLPTTREGGQPLSPSDLEGVEIRMSADGGANFGPEAMVGPAGTQEFVVDNLVAGSYLFRLVVVDVDGRRSDSYDAVADVIAPPSALADVTVVVTG